MRYEELYVQKYELELQVNDLLKRCFGYGMETKRLQGDIDRQKSTIRENHRELEAIKNALEQRNVSVASLSEQV
jgi:peptidoglycan hydrolase CwlO-like protein